LTPGTAQIGALKLEATKAVIQGKMKKRGKDMNYKWWFQIFLIFTPTWGNDAI